MVIAQFVLAALLAAAAGSGLTVDENGFVTVDPESATRERLCLDRIREADAHYEARKGNLFQARQAAEKYEMILQGPDAVDPWVRVGIEFRIAKLHRQLAHPHSDAPPDSRLFRETDETEYRQAIAWYEAIVDQAEEAFPHKAARALLDMAEVHRTLREIDQWALCTARARRIARHSVPADLLVAHELKELEERAFKSLLFFLKEITPEIRARIVKENPDDEAVILALGPEPEAEASEARQAEAPVEASAAGEPPVTAIAAASEAPEPRTTAKNEIVQPNRTMMVVTVAVVSAMVVIAVLVVIQGRARVKGPRT